MQTTVGSPYDEMLDWAEKFLRGGKSAHVSGGKHQNLARSFSWRRTTTGAQTRQTSLMDADKKILVLGATGFSPSVKAYAWDSLPPALNVADFDVVIVDLCPLEDDDALCAGLPVETLPSPDVFGRLIFRQGSEVVAIGNLQLLLSDKATRSNWWLPARYQEVRIEGSVKQQQGTGWDWYFQKVKTSQKYFDHVTPHAVVVPAYPLERVHPAIKFVETLATSLATTRDGKAVGLSLEFRALGEIKQCWQSRDRWSCFPHRQSYLMLRRSP
jgi:hypothetical protein